MNEILLVDDEPKFLATLSCALEDEYQLRTATSAEEALRAVLDSCPELLITDYMMPGMDGLEFIEALKGQDCQPRIIVLSGRLNQEIQHRAMALGASDCIHKPFDLHDLRHRIERALQAPSA